MAVWICLVLAAGIALGEGFGLRIDAPGEVIRPGRPVIVSFTVPEEGDCDVIITEIGGTVGDIESQPFLEAIRQVALEQGKENCLFIHVTLVP